MLTVLLHREWNGSTVAIEIFETNSSFYWYKVFAKEKLKDRKIIIFRKAEIHGDICYWACCGYDGLFGKLRALCGPNGPSNMEQSIQPLLVQTKERKKKEGPKGWTAIDRPREEIA